MKKYKEFNKKNYPNIYEFREKGNDLLELLCEKILKFLNKILK